MSSVKTIDLGLKNAYDELFMDDKGRVENRAPKILDIPITEIDNFPEHPFKVKIDEDMEQLVQSVKERGIITPITLRQKENGRYEIVSGHRRRKACELAGLPTVRAEVQDLTRDEAIILMVESNLQRSHILPSEKAFSYKMKLEAMKRQAGRPKKENGVPVGPDSLIGKSREILAVDSPDSNTQIQRYIRLTNLSPTLLDMVDDGKIAIRPAVEISYLEKEEQEALIETIALEEATPSLAQAIKMRDFSKNGKLNEDVILSIISEEKPNQRAKFSIPTERISKFIPDNISPKQTEEYVLKALEYYHHYRQKQRELER
ncbi:ParB/RepB/Spo0J family partition protein [Papillibacter cinnamivorans]|uniref:Chromosome partitioning protein, ParB family n=1 Tax=Papillibacter cinnamivorans DSM 12816 TaxID=1122930 RepID=A0A1W2AS32_9FIRM|nr:ParB/RepB/Spo0J family partition protein [Papillibacter cinnamivorans]SMC63008.1 chromosome partitioning protein, ParB family [Papillibacter cinnamivorans DSM 12816]